MKTEIHPKIKLAVFMSHPIHYLVGLAREIKKEEDINSHIFFCSDFGIREGMDITFGKKVKWYGDDFLTGLRFSFLKNISLHKDPGAFFSLINPSIFRELRKGRFDALFIHGWNYFSNWLALAAAYLIGIPILLRGENPFNQEILKPKWKIFIKKIIFGKILFPKIAAFLYIGEENKNFYKFYGVPESKLFFVPYSVDNGKFFKENEKEKPRRAANRALLGIAGDSAVIISVGKLIDKKRHGDLLAAYRILTSDLKLETDLLLAGDGWLRPQLEEYAAKNRLKGVHFLGFKNQDDLPVYYSLSDIFVFPSGFGETWGVVVNEALCFGLPVIASDSVGSVKDLVRPDQNGYIFPAGNIRELAKYLEILVKDAKKRAGFGRKSREIIEEYGFKKDVEGIKKALNAIGHKNAGIS